MTNGWLEVVREALKVPGLLVKIYGDLARPGVRQVGKALETVLGLGNTILLPVALANERSRIYVEKNLESYRARLEKVPEEKIVPVAPEVGVPIVEKLAYVRDDRLSELYVTLLAKASQSDTVAQAHPSFVNVIGNLAPDEAKLLEYFVQYKNLPFATAKWAEPDSAVSAEDADLLLAPDHFDGLTFPMNVAAYISNLSGLGLVSIHHDRAIEPENIFYTPIEAYWRARLPESNPNYPERQLRFDHGLVGSTNYGRQFLAACHQQR